MEHDEGARIINDAQAKGLKVLNEYEAKRFLAAFGVPVCREVVASSGEAAAAAAEAMGYPVALKAFGSTLMHKTELGGVALDLRDRQVVIREAERLLKIPGCEGILVQEMVRGIREFVCGLIRDPSFGPTVMFGLGGVMTEILNDTVFRVAPLSLDETQDMVCAIRSPRVLAAFRGEAAVDLAALGRILVILGEIGLRFPQVTEMDLNPLKIRSDGSPVAVDALVILGE
ncbi:MAG: acetate--CoA ligase family protein [Syntrophales bacterium]|nr:acetate--CoA ligase family protein [Syntrophales bacterium]